MTTNRRSWNEELTIIDRTMRAISGVTDPEELVSIYWEGICELLPLQARVADKFSLIRSLHHRVNIHNDGSITVLTGKEPTVLDPTSTARSEHPDFGMIASRLRGRGAGCLAVLEEDELLGIVTTTDLLDLIGRAPGRPPVRPERVRRS